MPATKNDNNPKTQGNNTKSSTLNKPGANSQVIEIDLFELFIELRKHILWILLATFLGGAFGFAVSKLAITPTYTSTSMIYVMSKETTLTSLADLQIGTQLTQDYRVLCTSRTVMEDVISKLELTDMDYLKLRNKITMNNPQNTRILNISVLDTDPVRAKQIADAVAECASNYIADIMEQDPPKIIEYGEIPIRRTGPKTGKNTAVGALLALMLMVGMIIVSMVTNDSIKTEDDIEKYFELPVLAVIPEKNAKAAREEKTYGAPGRGRKRSEKERGGKRS